MEIEKMNKAQLTEHIGELNAALAAAKAATADEVVTTLRTDIATRDERIAELEAQLTDAKATADQVPELQQMVRELNNRSVAENATADKRKPLVPHDGKQVRVLFGATIKGKQHTVAEIQNDSELLDHLIMIKSGCIQVHNS
jgi:chromosome segregation ATPase